MRGFTLIEVLIVLTVMMIAISIVTPGLFRTYERIETQSEEKMVKEILKDTGLAAFASQTPHVVIMSGNELEVVPEKDVWTFKRLTFPDSMEIHFNSRGFPDQDRVGIKAGAQKYTIGFKFWGASGG